MNCPIDPKPLQPPLRTEEFETLYHLLKESTVCQDLIPLLVYQVDTVDVSVLPHLAEQFDVLGYKGWLLANTEEKKRNLIRSAVRLHRKAGTPSAIIDSLFAVGIELESIVENPPLVFGGRWNHRGTETYSGKLWDRFILNFVEDVPDNKIELVNALVDVWKNERSQRLFQCPYLLFYDSVWQYNGVEQYDNCTTVFEQRWLRYNTVFSYDGEEIYDGYCDEPIPNYLFYDGTWDYDGDEFYAEKEL